MDEKEAEARPVMGTIFLVIFMMSSIARHCCLCCVIMVVMQCVRLSTPDIPQSGNLDTVV